MDGYQEFYDLMTVDDAAGRLGPLLPAPARWEEVDLLDSVGRVLAAPVFADADLPGFTRSTVDGYAVRARDTFGAGESQPAFFQVGTPVLMGQVPVGSVAEGFAWPIATGAMLPEGADAVVMVEYTATAGPGAIEVYRAAGTGENVVKADEDLARGALLFEAGHRVRPTDLGGLAAIGATRVRVFSRTRVGIVSTGDELVTADTAPAPGQVRDVNAWTLAALVKASGGIPVVAGIVRDDLQRLTEIIRDLAGSVDLLLISGGSSVGTRDHSLSALSSLGSPGVIAHGLAIKPGKPTILGVAGRLPYFGLPGHPVACAIVFEVMVRPVLHVLSGVGGAPEPRLVPALLTRNLASAPGREDYVRVRLVAREGRMWAEPLLGKSGVISTVARADGLVRIPLASDGLYQGEEVQVRLFEQA